MCHTFIVMIRRQFLISVTKALASFASAKVLIAQATQFSQKSNMSSNYITLFLCGDVMTGRGIDQVMPHPNNPHLYEPYVRNAKEYVALAEQTNGPIPKPVDYAYIWGDALLEFQRFVPDAKIINLETSITSNDTHWPGKGIHYRMHPQNIPCLTAAEIDCCVLANNHVLDWGYKGLSDTLDALQHANIKIEGAGRNSDEANAPAIIGVADNSRVIVFSYGMESSGVPYEWAAGRDMAGVNLLTDLSAKTIKRIAQQVGSVKQPGDIVVASIHWGGNWGYHIPNNHIQFAHQLIDAGVDVIHGHSSHHAIGIEVYNDKPIIYGCGDFLNDYEGISGYERYRDDLALMYFVRMNPETGKLVALEMVPTQIKRFRSHRASNEDALWLQKTLNRECTQFEARVELTNDKNLVLHW
jgi:poly-gamma-glutamate synthesis protein (capsule biosynthesis protein)